MVSARQGYALLAAGGVIVASIVVGLYPPGWAYTRDMLGIILSWPVVVGVVVVVAGVSFRRELSRFLGSLSTIRFPGGEVTSRQRDPQDGSRSEVLSTIGMLTRRLEEEGRARSMTAEAAVELLRKERANSEYWKFEFLVLFLIPQTVSVLRWFSEATVPVPRPQYEHLWAVVVADAQQRSVMLDVLIHFALLYEANNGVCISERGRAFLRFVEWKHLQTGSGG